MASSQKLLTNWKIFPCFNVKNVLFKMKNMKGNNWNIKKDIVSNHRV